MRLKAAVITLGCRLNHADTALLTARVERAGFEPVQYDAEDIDLIIINSCAVTAEAVRKSRQTLRHCRKKHPSAEIVFTGCAAGAAEEEIKRDGATAVFCNEWKKQLEEFLKNRRHCFDCAAGDVFFENTISSFPFRSRAFIKIQEGCNNFCTYCIVPHVRGRERSRAFDEVLADCKNAVEKGFPEIILTGVNTCTYNDNGRTLANLIEEISNINGDFRIRLSSTEPDFKNIGLLDVMAQNPKICRFLHLSLQHGCDRILEKMNRHYTTDVFAGFVGLAREKMPDIHIGTDVIAGFPGETEEDFQISCRFIENMEFANTHIFTYSRRPGTPAADFPQQIAENVKKERAAILRQTANTAALSFAKSQLGKTLDVIFERSRNGRITGWSGNYLGVFAPEKSFPTGKIVKLNATRENLAIFHGETVE